MSKCYLEPEFNQCPHFIKYGRLCSNKNKCSFQSDFEEPEQKPDKWYKKYYQNDGMRWK